MRIPASLVAVLIVSLLAPPAAFATLVGDTTETVRSTVKAVQDTLSDPPIPSVPPPQAPPAPAASPVPTEPSPVRTPASPAERSAPDKPAADGANAAAGKSVGTVADTVTETAKQPLPVANGDGGRPSPVPGGGDDAVGTGPRALDTPSGGGDAGASGAVSGARATRAPPSVGAGAVVDLQRWLARVGPAIPLLGGTVDGGSAASAVERSLLRAAVAAAGPLLLAASSAAVVTGDSPPAGHRGAANGPQATLLHLPVATDWRKVVYGFVLVAMLGLLGFTVWKELGPAFRTGLR